MLNYIFGSALYPKVNREIYRARWQAASAFSFDQIFSDLPLPRERYLAVMRQLNSAVPYPSDGRLI